MSLGIWFFVFGLTQPSLALTYPLEVKDGVQIDAMVARLPGMGEGLGKDQGFYNRPLVAKKLQLVGLAKQNGCQYKYKLQYEFKGRIRVQEEGQVLDKQQCLPGSVNAAE